MSLDLHHWAAQIRAGDVRAVSRAISAVENHEPPAQELLERLSSAAGNAYVIGVTGPPGAGKSTLVDRLAAHYRALGKTVGIIAVDPSSPYTGGAILGDRIRMQGHAGDAGVFIRSMATRGFLGGLAGATADVVLVLGAAGREIVFIETVGVGQDEVDVVRLADCTLVVLVPGAGDDVQSMKAGLMEVADVFAINKADRDGADRLEQQLQATLQLAPGHPGALPPVLRTVASEGRGIPELGAALDLFRATPEAAEKQGARQKELWKRRLIILLGEHLIERTLRAPNGEQLLDLLVSDVANRKKTAHAAVQELLEIDSNRDQ